MMISWRTPFVGGPPANNGCVVVHQRNEFEFCARAPQPTWQTVLNHDNAVPYDRLVAYRKSLCSEPAAVALSSDRPAAFLAYVVQANAS